MCLSQISMRQEDGFITVPCGSCYQCLTKRRNEWTFRLQQEIKVSTSAIFLTLTYDDENLPSDGNINTKHVQLFCKKMRNYQHPSRNKIRYYFVGEYGTKTQRPHYHAILFNCDYKTQENIYTVDKDKKPNGLWTYGNIQIGSATQASIHYVTGYIITKKTGEKGTRTPPFALMSKGLGSNYITDESKKHHFNLYDKVSSGDGKTISIPRYYREKLWTGFEKMVASDNALKAAQKNEEKLEKLAKEKGVNYYHQIKKMQDARTKIMLKQQKNKNYE